MRETYMDSELALICWANWKMTQGDHEGWGGNDLGDRVPRAPGTHSDPVQAEVIRSQCDRDAYCASVVDRIIRTYSEETRLVLRSIYIGRQTNITIGRSVHGDVVCFRYEGGVSPSVCAKRLRVAVDHVKYILRKTKRSLKHDLKVFRAIRAGLIGPEGNLRAS